MGFFENYIIGLGPIFAYIAVFITIFAESGLLIGFILPGDSLLIPLGLLASQGHFNLLILCVLTGVATIIGNQVGYAFGKSVGPALFNRENSRFFNREHLKKAHEFYETHGAQTLVIARFVPFARTFAPILAGISEMNYRIFMIYNVLGGILWTSGVMILGYTLGKVIPNIDHYILLITGIVFVLSILPAGIRYLMQRAAKA